MLDITIRAKLLVLAGILLAVLVASNIYLRSELSAGSSALQNQTSVQQGLESVTGALRDFGEITGTIATSVEEQKAASAEIANNASQVATGTQEVSSNITEVNQAAVDTGAAAGQVLSSATELTDQAAVLKASITSFPEQVRAA